MSSVSGKSIGTVGNIYMAGINDHITAHFRTLIALKLEQMEAVVEVVPADMDETGSMYEELIYRANVRNFSYLALCPEDGRLEMLDGLQIQLADPASFYKSLRNNEKKVAVARDADGKEVVAFGICAGYPMSNGERSMALVAAVPIEYVSAMLGTDEENAIIYSHIIRRDGSFIVSDISAEYTDYFSSLYERYQNDNPEEIAAFIQELSSAMNDKEVYKGIMNFNESSQQVYCTPLPYSEWHLVTILPFGTLNESVATLNNKRIFATICVSLVIVVVILLVFYFYYKMTCRQ